MERKTQLEPLSTARKKKDLFIAIAGAKRKTPSLFGDLRRSARRHGGSVHGDHLCKCRVSRRRGGLRGSFKEGRKEGQSLIDLEEIL
jgi:hypothetical protein